MKNIFTKIFIVTSLLFSQDIFASELGAANFTVGFTVVDAECDLLGSITYEAIGGTAPYVININGATWADAGGQGIFDDLAAGDYFVSFTDATGCTFFQTVTVSGEGLIVEIFCGIATNTIIAQVSGGTAPYTFSWSNGVLGQSIEILDEGIYEVTVVDAEGCFYSTQYTYTADGQDPCGIGLEGNHLRILEGPCNSGTLDRYSILLNGNILNASNCYYFLSEEDVLMDDNEIAIENTSDQDNVLNGISTLDLVLLFRGLVFGFNDNFEIVAADFDDDQVLSTNDIIEMRRYILGLESGIEYQQYRIVDLDYEFPADFGPFNITTDFTTINFNSSDLADGSINARVIKNGDLNNSAFFNSEIETDTREATSLSFDDLNMEAAEQYSVIFELSSSEDIEAATFELQGEGLNILAIDELGNDLMYHNKFGAAGFSYYTNNPANTMLFSMELEAITDGKLSEKLTLNDDFLNETVNSNLGLSKVNLIVNINTTVEELTEELFTIHPNPVQESLNITFEENVSTKYIELVAINGKSINRFETTANQFSINVQELQAKGLYLVRITQGGKTAIKKVVIQ